MDIKEILKQYAGHSLLKGLAAQVADPQIRSIQVCGACASSLPVLFSSMIEHASETAAMPYLFVLDDAEEAGYFYHDLTQILGESFVFYYPSSYRRAIKFAQKDSANEILRTEVLSRLQTGTYPLFIVTYPEALAEKVVSRKSLQEKTLRIRNGECIEITEIRKTLIDFGFKNVDYVYEPGQFAIRGSIVDIFSFSSEYPFRVDFFGNEVDSIRSFDVQTQLSQDKLNEIAIVPELQSGAGSDNMPFTDFLPEQTMLVLKDLSFLCDSVEKAYREGFSQQAILERQAQSEMDEQEIYQQMKRECQLVERDVFVKGISRFRRIECAATVTGTPQATVRFEMVPQPVFHKNFELVQQTLSDFKAKGYQIYILADSEKQTERLQTIFDEQKSCLTFTPINRTLHEGFTDHTLKACFFTDHQIFDRYHKYNLKSDKARSGKVALSLKEIQQFQIGDYVIHVDHGVGRFGGLIQIPNGKNMQEVIKIIYQNDDVVFVSIHALHKVSKYKGKDGEPPHLSKLGTGAWERLKEKTKSKIKDIARDLIRLYSLRKEEKGFAFSPDSFLQHELEASFLYEDTPDQLKATQDVKADMEKDKPMDRLVCGDVGFGKTEVAIRAAFKACADNKQVAVMVPTTVLAYQHFQTFKKRLKDMPVRIDYLTRARTATQTRAVLKNLADGNIDIIIGTHKLIGKTVKFKDLGLLIIDEEQKFGVATKEKLRQLKVNVDTLTLTATPIPRTLQFSLMGARDLSVIQTPPPNRYPIQTEVHTFSADVICEAINFEMSRNGQVFIVNNRIASLYDLEAMIRKRIPDVRICIGHGRMASEELEKVILDFANYDYDVLISTTIIESGIDIPNANTIIINGAHNFGLSDLHQMRGRVGRGNKKAFCYLLAPPLSSLTQEARRRLQAIENFSDLGSGIHIAMQDLDIRGAGNLLGAEQSGFIADLGYETYQKILAEAIKELKNEEFNDLYEEELAQGKELGGETFVEECSLESDLRMSFPETYVPSSSERMLLYRELDNLEEDQDIEKFRARMLDRFGPIPPEGEELIEVVRLRRIGKKLGAEKVYLKGGNMTLFFVSNPDSAYYKSKAFGQCIQYASIYAHRCRLREIKDKRSLVIEEVKNVKEAVSILQQISEIVC